MEDTNNQPESDEMRIVSKAVEMLKTVYDPEIPVNVYDLGLIYRAEYTVEDKTLHVDMTLTAPSCPAADFIMEDIRQKLVELPGGQVLPLVVGLMVNDNRHRNDVDTELFSPLWEDAAVRIGYNRCFHR